MDGGSKSSRGKAAKRPKYPDYSLSRQEQLRNAKTAKSTGRRPKSEKLAEVTREEDVYPAGVPQQDYIPETSRIVTRLFNGQKEVVLYQIYRQKWGTERGVLSDVLPRLEYGFEVMVAIVFLIHCIGLSFDQAQSVPAFFLSARTQQIRDRQPARTVIAGMERRTRYSLRVDSPLPYRVYG